eukprot:TRINITY_DN15567_c0_g1_i2.p1 TRINITY_DN15567_c0_g1~~TRINITY_DN15567_c0_g1_i2.p1  ORF type:complete len:224 (+),score=23.38 TRINITY_DN15567_c0_g1_i2:717-1388(+)
MCAVLGQLGTHVKVGIDICLSKSYLRVSVARLGPLADLTMRALKRYLMDAIVAAPGACAARVLTAYSMNECPHFKGENMCSSRCYIFEWTPASFGLPTQVNFDFLVGLVNTYGVQGLLDFKGSVTDAVVGAGVKVKTAPLQAESRLKRFMIWNMGWLGMSLGKEFDNADCKERAEKKEERRLEQRIGKVRDQVQEWVTPTRPEIDPATCAVMHDARLRAKLSD